MVEAVDVAVRLRGFAVLADLRQIYGDSPIPRAPLEKGFEFDGVAFPSSAHRGSSSPRFRQLAAGERCRQPRERAERARDPHTLAGRAQVHAHAPRQPVRARAEAAGPARLQDARSRRGPRLFETATDGSPLRRWRPGAHAGFPATLGRERWRSTKSSSGMSAVRARGDPATPRRPPASRTARIARRPPVAPTPSWASPPPSAPGRAACGCAGARRARTPCAAGSGGRGPSGRWRSESCAAASRAR